MTGLCCHKSFYQNNRKQLAAFLETIKQGIIIFLNNPEKTFVVAQKYFPVVEPSILREALEKIRNGDIYCTHFTFTDAEIQEGLLMRRIQLSLKEVKRFIV